MTMHGIGKKYKNIKRYREIWAILKKYGFTMIAEKMEVGYPFSKHLFKRSKKLVQNYSRAQRLRLALEELGPTFIKFGQILSTRHDILPLDVTEEISKLQDSVRAFDFDIAKDIFKKELNCDIDDVFSYLDKKPIAAASIGQVYRGKLKNGKWVVLKIQRPSIKKIIENDIDILFSITSLIDDYFSKNTKIKYSELVEEFSYYIRKELDYTYEAQNALKFKEVFKEKDNLVIPKIYWEYTTKKLLVMEKIEGVKLSDIETIKKKNINLKKLARDGALIFMEQVFIHNIFHGDPHPGNIIIQDDGKISYIDFGIVGYIDKLSSEFIKNILRASANKNIDRIIDSLYKIDAITDETKEIELRKDIYYILSHYYTIPMNKLNISDVLNELLLIVYKNNIKIPSQLTLLVKSMITIEGISKKLDPEFNISSLSKDILDSFNPDFHNIKERFIDILDYTIDNFQYVKMGPKSFMRILNNVEKNRFKINVKHEGLEGLKKELNNMTNKISLSLMVSSLIVGSSIVIYINSHNNRINVSIIGILGYLIGAILGIGIVISILINFKNFNDK